MKFYDNIDFQLAELKPKNFYLNSFYTQDDRNGIGLESFNSK